MNARTKLVIVSGMLLFFVGFVVATLSMPGSISLPQHPAATEVASIDTIGLTDAFESMQVIFVDFDPATGIPNRRVTNRPLTIIKPIDETSVPLLTALDRNFLIPELVLARYRNDPITQVFEPYFLVTLTNARVVSHTTFAENVLLPENASLPHMERVRFAYESAQWHWLPDDITTRIVTCDWDENGRVDMKDYAAMMLCASDANVDLDLCIAKFDAKANDIINAADLPAYLDHRTGP